MPAPLGGAQVAVGAGPVLQDQVLSHGSHPATAAERAALHLAAVALVHRIKRVRRVGEQPFATDAMAFPADRFPHFSWPNDESPATAYGYLERSFGVLVSYVQERIRVGRLGATEARLLGGSTGEPALEVLRTAFDLAGIEVEYRRTVVLSSRHHYLVELRQASPQLG